MRLSERVNDEVGRLLNGKDNPHAPAIGHLAVAAARSAESLIYLADIDDIRFKDIWPNDGYDNDSVDDDHVRWAATGAVTSLDLCIAAAGRLAGFAKRPPQGEDSIRDYYRVENTGKVIDLRHRITLPWRTWIDAIVADKRYETLLRVRNALVHADALRISHATTGSLQGHLMRYGYNAGPLIQRVQSSAPLTVRSREIIETSRDVSLTHVNSFVSVLESLP